MFGSCMVSDARRELRVDDRVVDLPPLAFELLVLLIRARDRVMTHHECIERLWGHTALSDSALARLVSVIRKVIDSGSQPTKESRGRRTKPFSCIKTLHRIGYRFVADVVVLDDDDARVQGVKRLAALGSNLRVGLLPCRNASRLARHDWCRVGLMSLVAGALARDVRLDVLGPETFQFQADEVDNPALSDLAAHQLLRGYELTVLTQCELRFDGDQVWLDLRLLRATGATTQLALKGHDLIELARLTARSIEDRLFAADAFPVDFDSGDDFVNLAFARAIELYFHEDFVTAAELLTAVCRMGDGNLRTELWRLRALCNSGDPRSRDAGQRLLQRAEHAGDIAVAVRAHAALSMLPYTASDAEAAHASAEHRRRAVEGVLPGCREPWVLSLRLLDAFDAHEQGHLGRSRSLHNALIDDSTTVGNGHVAMMAHFNLATVEATAGDLPASHRHLHDALARVGSVRHEVAHTAVLGWLAWIEASQGLFDAAEVNAMASIQALRRLRSPSHGAAAMAAVAWVLLERLDRSRLAELVELTSAFEHRATQPRVAIPSAFVNACAWLSAGKIADARELLERAQCSPMDGVSVTVRRLVSLLSFRLAIAQRASAWAKVCLKRLEGLPTFGADPELRALRFRLDAVRCWQQGDLGGTTAALRKLIRALPAGVERSRACLDLVYLVAPERRSRTLREQTLQAAGSWGHQHPLAWPAAESLADSISALSSRLGGIRTRVLAWYSGNEPMWVADWMPPMHEQGLGNFDGIVTAVDSAGRVLSLPSDSWLPR